MHPILILSKAKILYGNVLEQNRKFEVFVVHNHLMVMHLPHDNVMLCMVQLSFTITQEALSS